MPEPHGRFTIDGDNNEIDLAKTTIDRCTFPFSKLRGDIEIRFKAPQKMRKLPSGRPALAFCHSRERVLDINSSARKAKQRSVLIHEIGHMVDHDRLGAPRRQELMALMRRPGEHWTAGKYEQRPCECFAETFVRAFSDVRSALEGYYKRHIADGKLQRYREIVMSGAGEVPTRTPEEEAAEDEPEIDPDDTRVLAEDDDVDVPASHIPVNVVLGQTGTIRDGTPFLHPGSRLRITSADGTQTFDLVGKTLDGRFRFAVVRTGKLVDGEDLAALLMVEASRVSNVQPPDEG